MRENKWEMIKVSSFDASFKKRNKWTRIFLVKNQSGKLSRKLSIYNFCWLFALVLSKIHDKFSNTIFAKIASLLFDLFSFFI